MRLPIIIAGLLVLFGFSTPVMSQLPIQPIEPSTTNKQELWKASKQLRRNFRLWRKQGISNYRYTFSNGCFCLPEARGPVVIEVRNGVTTSITDANTGEPVNEEFFQSFNTIPKLFLTIRDAIARRADRVDVEYDRTLGYPTNIAIDFSFQIADEELFITVENLEVLD
ncbi:MAG: DUF6174 domain-containing protein [Calothrix sp. MO_192.B10]|nr:DUF6174 domain-containing protein [Calothrix sp. MO_192.B10]